MNKGLSRALGTMLLVAAAFAATSCTSPGNPNATSSSIAPSSAGPSLTPEPLGPSAPAPAAGSTATSAPTDAAKIPSKAEAQPQAAPKPTFAPSERKYLASRVPEGTDPNAVLQAGQEMCDQFEAVKAVDPKAVVSQIIEKGEGAESVDAIAELCPRLQPQLEAARRGFTDGSFTIGSPAPKAGGGSISAGKYEAWNPSPSCTLAVYDAAGNTIAESNGGSAVTVPADAVRVVSDGCYTWLAA